MAKFLGIHRVPQGTSEEQIKQGWEGYRQSCNAMGITAISLVYNIGRGIAYCQTEAEAESQVRETHQGTVFPLEDVIEVKTL